MDVLLRAGLLDGLEVVVAGAPAPHDAVAAEVARGCRELGAGTHRCLVRGGELVDAPPAVSALRALVCDGAGLFAAGLAAAEGADGGGGLAALRACVDGTWEAVSAVVAPGLAEEGAAPGRVLLIAPPPGGEAEREGARAALVNLARTLSIEWARHGVTSVSIAPGGDTAPGALATLCAYLASDAGAYHSGCELDLRGPRA